MANTYKWQISRLDAKIHQYEQDNVIYNIHWRLIGSDESEPPYRSSQLGLCGVKYIEGEPFIPYADLTKEDVVGWLESTLDVETIKEEIDSKIELQKNPTDEHLYPDWE